MGRSLELARADGAVLTPVPAASLGRLAADRLLRALETGAIPLGSRLVEARLAELLGVSRGPIRDALQYLEQQGFVHRLPHRGSFAATLAPEELVDIFILRADLEALAARLAATQPRLSIPLPATAFPSPCGAGVWPRSVSASS